MKAIFPHSDTFGKFFPQSAEKPKRRPLSSQNSFPSQIVLKSEEFQPYKIFFEGSNSAEKNSRSIPQD